MCLEVKFVFVATLFSCVLISRYQIKDVDLKGNKAVSHTGGCSTHSRSSGHYKKFIFLLLIYARHSGTLSLMWHRINFYLTVIRGSIALADENVAR